MERTILAPTYHTTLWFVQYSDLERRLRFRRAPKYIGQLAQRRVAAGRRAAVVTVGVFQTVLRRGGPTEEAHRTGTEESAGGTTRVLSVVNAATCPGESGGAGIS